MLFLVVLRIETVALRKKSWSASSVCTAAVSETVPCDGFVLPRSSARKFIFHFVGFAIVKSKFCVSGKRGTTIKQHLAALHLSPFSLVATYLYIYLDVYDVVYQWRCTNQPNKHP